MGGKSDFERAKEEFYRENKGNIKCAAENKIPALKCSGVMTIHHSRGRIGYLLTDKTNFLFLCRAHHDRVERYPEEAKELGLTK